METKRIAVTLDSEITKDIKKLTDNRGFKKSIRVFIHATYHLPEDEKALIRYQSRKVTREQIDLYEDSLAVIDDWVQRYKKKGRSEVSRSLIIRHACDQLLKDLQHRNIDDQNKRVLPFQFAAGTKDKLDQWMSFGDRSEMIEQYILRDYTPSDSDKHKPASTENIAFSLHDDVINLMDAVAKQKQVSRVDVMQEVVDHFLDHPRNKGDESSQILERNLYHVLHSYETRKGTERLQEALSSYWTNKNR